MRRVTWLKIRFASRMDDYARLEAAYNDETDPEKFIRLRNGCRNHGRQHWPAKDRRQREAAKAAARKAGLPENEYDKPEWKVHQTVSSLSRHRQTLYGRLIAASLTTRLQQAWFKACSWDLVEHFTMLAGGDEVLGSAMLAHWMQLKDREIFKVSTTTSSVGETRTDNSRSSVYRIYPSSLMP